MKTLVFLFFTIPVISLGQEVRQNFEDNDLNLWYQNIQGRWEIDSNQPIAGKYSLHHAFDNDSDGTDWISFFHKPFNLNDTQTVWRFSIRYKYKPSSYNNWGVMLASSNCPGDDKLMDYALVAGVNFHDNDDIIHLWKQKGEKIESLLSTGFNWEKNVRPNQAVNFKIRRNPDGIFTMEIDTAGNGYFEIGRTIETEITQTRSLVIYYKYSSTYDRGLFIDDLSISGKFSDTSQAAKIIAVHPISSTNLIVEFNQVIKLNAESRIYIEGFGFSSIRNMMGKYVKISLPFEMKPGTAYILNASGISDMYGNQVSDNNRIAEFYYPAAYNVVINEILADPSPSVMLPDAEYIELLNTTSYNISLFEWQIMAGNKKATFPNITINHGEYMTLCDENVVSQFQSLQVTPKGLTSFPVLNNDGAMVALLDASGRMIHAVNYSNSWYDSNKKKEGGWSLEMINPKEPCIGKGNWKESVNYLGGTPCKINSVYSDIFEYSSPRLWRSAVTDSNSLMLYFSEPMDSNTLVNKDSYTIDHDFGDPLRILPSWPIADRVELFFCKKFEKDIMYKILLSSDICNCSKMTSGTKQVSFFQIPALPDSGDIVINEIMFDPKENLAEYIELYNQSDKTIDLKNCLLKVGEDNQLKKTVSDDYFPMLPNTYVVISHDYSGIDSENEFKHPELVVKMSGMPVLPNEGSKVSILDKHGKTLDAVAYSPSCHHPLLSITKGVSLERVSPLVSGLEPKNWQSASSDAGYQTPAAPNSQYETTISSRKVTLSTGVITPNSDGTDDELSVIYQMDEPGYMARVYVYDSFGNQVFILAQGSILGTSGSFVYSGRDERGYPLKTGYYILYFEAYNTTAKPYIYKKAFVIAN